MMKSSEKKLRSVKQEESFVVVDQGVDSKNPNIIPPEDVNMFEHELGIVIGQRLKRGRYGVVYEGKFTEQFSFEKLTNKKFHYFFCKQEHKLDDCMKCGQKFAMKFSDIEKRKAYCIEDIEERVQQEVKFIKRIQYGLENMCVRTYCILAINPVRYYFFMELADTNLQCLISEYSASNRLLNSIFVIGLFESLVRTIQILHQQKMTYGMMRTSNILIFYNTSNVNEPFRVKIADFVHSIQIDASEVQLGVIDDAVEQDLDDLFYIHYEIFALTRLPFSKYQAFKESLKVMTDVSAHQNSVQTLDKVLLLISKFKDQQQQQNLLQENSMV